MSLLDKALFEFLEEYDSDNNLTFNKYDYSIEEYFLLRRISRSVYAIFSV
jgi:hypothetical protein